MELFNMIDTWPLETPSPLRMFLEVSIEDLNRDVTRVKEDFESQISATTGYPLEDRWALFVSAPDYLSNHLDHWPLEVSYIEQYSGDEWYFLLGYPPGLRLSMIDQLESLSRMYRIDEPTLNALKEKVLELNIKSFKNNPIIEAYFGVY